LGKHLGARKEEERNATPAAVEGGGAELFGKPLRAYRKSEKSKAEVHRERELKCAGSSRGREKSGPGSTLYGAKLEV
jgi:hypothetical protein